MPTFRLRYRTWFKGLPPRPTRVEVPGWGGAATRAAAGAWRARAVLRAVRREDAGP